MCGLYERKIREINPTIQHISYDISDLYNFIDGLADLSALVYVSLTPYFFLFFEVALLIFSPSNG
jgi:Enhancer of rudimentary